jgi:predicted dehydrogenase
MSPTPLPQGLPHTRWGICGTGRMASTIASELAALRDQGAQLCAVASRNLAVAETFARTHAVPRAYGSYADLARDAAVDVIYIATPPSLHCENALDCIEHRKAVLCEKPFALNAAQATRMVRAARERGVFLMEAMWTRFLPAIAAVRTLIADGALGKIRLLVGGGGFIPGFDPRTPLFDRALGGGVLLDAGVYLVSLASMLLGNPQEVIARGILGRSGVDEQDALLLRYPGGAQALFYVSLSTRRSPDLEILGEDGRLLIEAPVFRPTRLVLSKANAQPSVLEHPVDGPGYRGELLEVMAAVATGRRESLVMPLSDSVSVMRTLDSIRNAVGLRYPQE